MKQIRYNGYYNWKREIGIFIRRVDYLVARGYSWEEIAYYLHDEPWRVKTFHEFSSDVKDFYVNGWCL